MSIRQQPRNSTQRVSVLMTVRNGERFLAESLDSILNQTFTDFELIVVNDGSTDGTADILECYASKDGRVCVLSIPASGLPLALQAGSALLRGELVARMDADDIALPDRLARQVAFLDSHTEIAMVGGAISIISEDGRRLGGQRFPTDPGEIAVALRKASCFSQSTVMLRRRAYESVGGYRTAFPVSEDYDLWVRLAESFPLANLPVELIRYRFHTAQISGQKLVDECICAAGVRLSGRLRRDGVYDIFSDASHQVTLHSLLAMGVTEREIHEDIARAYLGRLGALSNIKVRGSQLTLVTESDAFISSHAHLTPWRLDLYTLSAKILWRQGHPLGALRFAGRAILADPDSLIRRIARRFARLIPRPSIGEKLSEKLGARQGAE